jgi:phosphoribosylaminoimidazole-succinocarboxamide synthase
MQDSSKKIYEGKAKIIYETENPDVLISYFKDDATAFNAQKRGMIVGKGEMNCRIASHLFQLLESRGIDTHYIDRLTANEMLIKAVEIVPLEVIVRNIAAGSLCKQTGLPEGLHLPQPIVEYCYKSDSLGDPLLTDDRLALLNVATPAEVATIGSLARRVNEVLTDFFAKCGIVLVDFKIEFGRDRTGNILLADEISPDSCRLWLANEPDPVLRILDKDRFRRDLGNVEGAYREVLRRVEGGA